MESDFGEVESDSDKARRCPSACSENKDYSMKRFLFDKRLAKHGLDEHAQLSLQLQLFHNYRQR